MTLDRYAKGNMSLREQFITLNDDDFTKMATINMANIYSKIDRYETSFLPSSKYIKNLIYNNEIMFNKWSEEVNRILFKKNIFSKLQNIEKNSFIEEKLVTSKKIVLFRGGYDDKDKNKGEVKYDLFVFNNSSDFENFKFSIHNEINIPFNSNKEFINKNVDLVYNTTK